MIFTLNPVEQAILTRFSCDKFSKRPIPNGTLERILKINQRTPTAMNFQNYRVIVVRDPKLIEEVRNSMGVGNKKKSENAIPVVFLSDLKPRLSIPMFTDLCKRGNIPDKFVGVVTKYMSAFIRQDWYDIAKTPIASLVRKKELLPKAMSAFSYGEKTVGLVVSNFVTLCTSNGIDTHVMESFADWKIQQALNIPSRFHPSLIVWCGYRSEEPKKTSLRYDSKDVLFEDNFGNPLKIPEELN